MRESDLRQHLIAEGVDDLALLEEDTAADPRFSANADELAKAGVKDFQLDYSVKALTRYDVAAAKLGQPAKA